jgi:hypothetical protein
MSKMQEPDPDPAEPSEQKPVDSVCPVCGSALLHEKCKVVCRSERCVYRIILTCAEF